MKHITRDRPLTPEEAARYKRVREQVAQEVPKASRFYLSDQEIAAILAGLRMLQTGRENLSQSIEDIATNGDLHVILTDKAIDRLCERLNFGDRA